MWSSFSLKKKAAEKTLISHVCAALCWTPQARSMFEFSVSSFRASYLLLYGETWGGDYTGNTQKGRETTTVISS